MKTSRALARDFSLRAERVNNVGRVAPRFVLFLLYLKHDQKIDRIRKKQLFSLHCASHFITTRRG